LVAVSAVRPAECDDAGNMVAARATSLADLQKRRGAALADVLRRVDAREGTSHAARGTHWYDHVTKDVSKINFNALRRQNRVPGLSPDQQSSKRAFGEYP
jgi:hypothetical protein